MGKKALVRFTTHFNNTLTSKLTYTLQSGFLSLHTRPLDACSTRSVAGIEHCEHRRQGETAFELVQLASHRSVDKIDHYCTRVLENVPISNDDTRVLRNYAVLWAAMALLAKYAELAENRLDKFNLTCLTDRSSLKGTRWGTWRRKSFRGMLTSYYNEHV